MTRLPSDFSYIVGNYQKTGIIYLGHYPEVTAPPLPTGTVRENLCVYSARLTVIYIMKKCVI